MNGKPTWEECQKVDYLALAYSTAEVSEQAMAMYRLLARLMGLEALWTREQDVTPNCAPCTE